MPNLQNDHFPLFGGQQCQGVHGLPLGRCGVGRALEPALRLPFPGQPPPETPPVIQSPIAKAPDAVMFRFGGRFGALQERDKCLLQNVFRFSVTEPEGPPVQQQLLRFRFVERLTPARLTCGIHSSDFTM